MEHTSIRINFETKKLLDSIKVHPRETYEGVIKRIIGELIIFKTQKTEGFV